MSPEQLSQTVSLVINQNLGLISLFFALILIGLWKESVTAIIDGIKFRLSNAYPDEDSIIFMALDGSETKARVIRIGILTSSFFIYKNNSKLTIPNEKLKDLYIQKLLPK